MDLLILATIDIAIFWLIYRNVTKRPKIVPQRFIRTPPARKVYPGDLLEAIKVAHIDRTRPSRAQILAREPISLN
jgi:hypothetical protein